jgi:hypothetical protein
MGLTEKGKRNLHYHRIWLRLLVVIVLGVAYVTGGNTLAGSGWDGLSVVDLQQYTVTEFPVPDRLLDVAIVSEDRVVASCTSTSARG